MRWHDAPAQITGDEAPSSGTVSQGRVNPALLNDSLRSHTVPNGLINSRLMCSIVRLESMIFMIVFRFAHKTT